MGDTDLLLAMYQRQVGRSEHYERLRAAVSNIVLAMGGALVALAGLDGAVTPSDGWLGVLLIMLALYGAAAAILHGDRSRRHGKRAGAYRDEIDRRVPSARINLVRESVAQKQTYLNSLWVWLHVGLAVAGLSVMLMATLG